MYTNFQMKLSHYKFAVEEILSIKHCQYVQKKYEPRHEKT